ncbi:hypothetical protein HDU76_002277 [Blyttiomyces sp. JEL0837]|nr:hypothetical protein HDU76_002277 [Blyttiomyces sp. JEL0837]
MTRPLSGPAITIDNEQYNKQLTNIKNFAKGPRQPYSQVQQWQYSTTTCTTTYLDHYCPKEIYTAIFDFAGPLTKFLNNHYTIDEIDALATDIWNDAIHINWQGDFNLLPLHGFPNVKSSLCRHPITRSMYDRLSSFKPERSSMNAIKVLVKDDKRVGFFDGTWNVVVRISENDQDTKEYNELFGGEFIRQGLFEPAGTDWHFIEDTIFGDLLVHIPLRFCWMDVVEPFVKANPLHMASLAIMFDHFDLLQIIIRDHIDGIDIRSWMERFDCLSYCVRNGNVEMFRLVYDLAKPLMRLDQNGRPVNPNGTFINFLNIIIRPEAETASKWLQIIDMLDYEGDEYSQLCVRYVCEATFTTATCPLSLWERFMDLRQRHHHAEENKPPIPWIQNMDQAKRYIKMDSGKLKSFEYFLEKLVYNSVYGDEELIWEWGEPPALTFNAVRHVVEIKKRELALMATMSEFESTSTSTTSTISPTTLTEDSEEHNLEKQLVEFIHTTMHYFLDQASLKDFLKLQHLCPCNNSCTINITTIKSYARCNDLSILQLLHQRGYLESTTLSSINLMDIAARYGYLNVEMASSE